MPRDPALVPFGLRPGTPQFQALLRDCTEPEFADKLRRLEGLSPRALRSEVGSAARVLDIFGDPAFLLRCRPGLDVGAHLQRGGMLIVERGDADRDVTGTIMGGLNMRIVEHCERRPKPWPPVGVWFDECTNAKTAGPFEERKAGECRKFLYHPRFICQHPNFVGGSEGFFTNCQEKHFYRCGDHLLARKLGGFVVGGTRRDDKQSRAELLDHVVADLMTFGPGWRYVVGPGGTRKEYVPMLPEPYPDWPGLREGKLKEKLCRIYSRPEYQNPRSGQDNATTSSTTSPGTTAPLIKSPDSSTPAQRWKKKQQTRKPPDAASDSGPAGESG